MPKISKKDQTREEQERERAMLESFKAKRSPHFAVGTDIVVNNEVRRIVDHHPLGLIVRRGFDGTTGSMWEDSLVTPINWRMP